MNHLRKIRRDATEWVGAAGLFPLLYPLVLAVGRQDRKTGGTR